MGMGGKGGKEKGSERGRRGKGRGWDGEVCVIVVGGIDAPGRSEESAELNGGKNSARNCAQSTGPQGPVLVSFPVVGAAWTRAGGGGGRVY